LAIVETFSDDMRCGDSEYALTRVKKEGGAVLKEFAFVGPQYPEYRRCKQGDKLDFRLPKAGGDKALGFLPSFFAWRSAEGDHSLAPITGPLGV
jgi:hypothetical protein